MLPQLWLLACQSEFGVQPTTDEPMDAVDAPYPEVIVPRVEAGRDAPTGDDPGADDPDRGTDPADDSAEETPPAEYEGTCTVPVPATTLVIDSEAGSATDGLVAWI